MKMVISGACHCGDVVFEANIDSEQVIICHCSDCQVISGTAFRSVVMSEPNGVVFKKGEAKEYIKIAESGNQRAQGFCQNCGSSLYATSVDTAERIYGIRLGTVTQRHALAPKSQIWCRSAVPWLDSMNEIPAHQTTSK